MVSWLLRYWSTRLGSKPLPMCEHRTAQCVAGYVSMPRRCGDTTGPLDFLRTRPHVLDRYLWMSIKARMARAKARARKATRARIRSQYPNLSNSKGYCGYCDKWGHKRDDAKSKVGAAAASADDGDVAAVMEVDDVVMRTGDDETSPAWCFALTSVCAVVGSACSLLLDSGSDENLCTPKFAELIRTSRDRSHLKLKDVQQNDLVISKVKRPCPCWWDRQVASMPWRQRPHSEFLRHRTTSCRWENWFERVSASIWVLVVARWKKDGRKVPVYLERHSLRVEAHVLQRASRPGYVAAGTAVTDERMDGVDVKESHSSSSSGPAVEATAVEPAAEAGTTPAPVLKMNQRVAFPVT